MKVYEDGKEVSLEFTEDDMLATVIAQIDKRANEKNMIVSEIKVDDRLVTQENEREFDSRAVKDVGRIDVVSEQESVLIKRALNEAYQYLPKLSQGLSDISLLFQAGSRNEAFDKFTECLNGWIQIISLMQSIERLKGLSYDSMQLKEGTVKAVNEKLLNLLSDTKAAMENDDIVTLSDLIEYELAPMAEKQMEIIQKLLDTINA